MRTTSSSFEVLDASESQLRAQEHRNKVSKYTAPYLRRRARGEKHPVEDFLFSYYSFTPGQLQRWHPGAGILLHGKAAMERRNWRYYRELTAAERETLGLLPEVAVTVDVPSFHTQRRRLLDWVQAILKGTQGREGHYGCFGMHEWAMVYRSEETRHEVPLRLGAKHTNAVVEAHRLRCTHLDAFRFYTPEAAPRNEHQLRREDQPLVEQPGCLHANMDLYKWAYKLSPLLSSELLFAVFELAWRIREVDMRAAPYDLHPWGYTPIPVETTAGKAEYVALQRGFAEQAAKLRGEILESLTQALATVGGNGASNS